jgi:rhamnosyltransferase
MKKVLVLLALRNGEKWIETQIDSILNQEDVNIKLLISNDCSTDSSLDIIKLKYSKDSRINILSRSTPSGSAANNFFELIKAVKHIDFDFVSFSDQDDIFDKRKYISAIYKLDSSKYQAYSSSVFSFGSSRNMINSQSRELTSIDFLFEGAGQGCTFVINKNFFFKIQNFITNNSSIISKFHFHDWLIYILSRAWGYDWYFDINVYTYYIN